MVNFFWTNGLNGLLFMRHLIWNGGQEKYPFLSNLVQKKSPVDANFSYQFSMLSYSASFGEKSWKWEFPNGVVVEAERHESFSITFVLGFVEHKRTLTNIKRTDGQTSVANNCESMDMIKDGCVLTLSKCYTRPYKLNTP